jgi:hypothetical protein
MEAARRALGGNWLRERAVDAAIASDEAVAYALEG